MTATILTGDCLSILPTLEANSIQTCVTSPPYFNLRDYQIDGQMGLESTVAEYVAKMVAVFREVKRVLRVDGTVWLNLGDCYAGGGREGGRNGDKQTSNPGSKLKRMPPQSVGRKQLLGIPWRVAFALQADGWWLRSAIVWVKPNPMPESVKDRPTSSYEHVFLLSQSETYYYDCDAIREPPTGRTDPITSFGHGAERNDEGHVYKLDGLKGANCRNVWTISPKPFKAHFATMPPKLAERCILAGSRVGDTVLDPFGGAGTTAVAALKHGRDCVMIELNPDYVAITEQRLGLGHNSLFGVSEL